MRGDLSLGIGCNIEPNDPPDGRLGNILLRAFGGYGVARRHGMTPRFPEDCHYRSVFSLPDTWWVSRDKLACLPSVLDTPEVEHLQGRWRGYLQSVDLWWSERHTIRALFMPADRVLRVLAANDHAVRGLGRDVVCLHVRRGDNVTNEEGSINCLPESYYREALALCDPRAEVVCFSDDPRWCREHLGDVCDRFSGSGAGPKEHSAEYASEVRTDWIDLLLMARLGPSHGHTATHIISNSTFAYVGAVLADPQRVIRPSYWVGPQLTDAGMDPSLLWPDDPAWSTVVETTPLPGTPVPVPCVRRHPLTSKPLCELVDEIGDLLMEQVHPEYFRCDGCQGDGYRIRSEGDL